jgi:hypothetical protein
VKPCKDVFILRRLSFCAREGDEIGRTDLPPVCFDESCGGSRRRSAHSDFSAPRYTGTYEHEVSLFENVPGSKGVLDIRCHAVGRHVVATDYSSVLIPCSRCFNETLFQPQCMSVKASNAKAHQIWMTVSHRATLALVDAEPRRRLNMTTQDPSSQRLTGSTLLVNGDRDLTFKLFPARAEKTGYSHGLTNREGLIYESTIECSYISHRSLSRL